MYFDAGTLSSSLLSSAITDSCDVSGVWQANAVKYEISMAGNGQVRMLALTPTDWLTASGTCTRRLPKDQVRCLVKFDNGREDVGIVSKDCASIHWGPPTDATAKTDFRYAWALDCDNADDTQLGWSIAQMPPGSGAPANAVNVKFHDPVNGFSGCLDRSGYYSRGAGEIPYLVGGRANLRAKRCRGRESMRKKRRGEKRRGEKRDREKNGEG
jgi:hypothetical protein